MAPRLMVPALLATDPIAEKFDWCGETKKGKLTVSGKMGKDVPKALKSVLKHTGIEQ